MSSAIYLDHNSTTPILPEVAQVIADCHHRCYRNPASQHSFGRLARKLLEDSRDQIVDLLGAEIHGSSADQLIFTGSGTEANNLAMFGLLGGRDGSPGHLVISSIEHPSITASAEYLERRGWEVDRLTVAQNGVAVCEHLHTLVRENTRLVSVMLGNNETGVLQPVAEMAAFCAERNIPFHCDAAQVAGKLPIKFRELGVTSLSIAAHKFSGPVGIGALLVRDGTSFVPDLYGGSQQLGLRPGTEPVALAAGMCRALEIWNRGQQQRIAKLAALRDRLEHTLLRGWPKAVILGETARRLPHTSNIALVGLNRQELFLALDQCGVACSTGSACASGSSQLSPVHLAMGCDREIAHSALRFSLGFDTSEDELDTAAERILITARRLARHNPT